MPVLPSTLWRGHMCVITFYVTPKFPSLNCSYDVKIWPLSFAPCLTNLFVPPYMDSSTRPHIQESDVQVTCRLNFWYYYFPFWVFALWNVVPSRSFSPCSWHILLEFLFHIKLQVKPIPLFTCTHVSFTKQKITVYILFPVHIILFIVRKMIPW